MSTQAKQSNASLNLTGKTAVVSGATQGIGQAVALRFAQLGVSRIFILGRNENAGQSVCAAARERAPDCACDFIQADLSTLKAIKKAAQTVEERAGSGGVDYLVMSQGGPPNGLYEETADGLDKSFVVQCLSRFGLASHLAAQQVLKPGSTVCSILSPGFELATIDLEDLSLKSLKDQAVWRPKLLLSQGKRDSMVMDALTMAFNRRYPSIHFYHLFPGYVQTNAASNRAFPFPFPQLNTLFGPLLSRTIGNTPTTYADIPLFFAANPEARKLTGWSFNERMRPIEPSGWAREVTNQDKVFQRCERFFET
ncbi:hypothetical protein CROQUDRAFT_652048 [Cronartium quercuum f. sp. fusiforme G11]|uniref:NAD(P)-binding protein n=1 Tax=Cronartium quercuum f. sp. fusiforme G11 TaxID=708437 RepID=A0A9P6NWI6_9BASI|nr:hypothetical protein CROQUDRAFT_652048 [Cronartium quercuum f. sp. fusiforme G11]